ncbi:MAG: hypothetical protein ACRDGR_04170, partial [bacterium]
IRPFLLGVAAGGVAFCIYGLAIAPGEFVADGLLEHGWSRLDGAEATSRAGKAVYPSRAGVWLELARHLGWGWTLLAAAGLALGVRDAVRDPASERGRIVATLVAWVLVGAIVFTATDWRQTKHLCLLVPALVALISALLPAAPPPVRLVLRAALVLSLGWNVRGIARLAAEFGSITVTPVW